MQRFTLIHDGSEQGWQAAYLAFHIAAQLGAPLLVLLFDSASDKNMLEKRAAQVEVGGHAAGVVISTQLITEFSVDSVAENSANSNGLFVPRRLIPDEKTARRFLEVLSYPLWIVSKESEIQGMAVLVGNPAAHETLINYVSTLSHRIQQPLTGLIPESKLALIPKTASAIAWLPLSNFSPAEITAALHKVGARVLFLPISRFSLIVGLSINCVIYPVA
ncbi:MAG: hypothetical protein WBL25_05520 [Anaerolineales bacterium]